jgi:hypothetical protein
MANSYPRKPRADSVFITAYLADVSTAGQIYVTPGFAGKIVRCTTALNNAITGADAGLTLKIGGTAVTGGTITITQSGSASGDVDECVPTGANTFTASQAVEIETDGASSTTAAVMVTLECVPI